MKAYVHLETFNGNSQILDLADTYRNKLGAHGSAEEACTSRECHGVYGRGDLA